MTEEKQIGPGGACGPCGTFTMMGLAFECSECGRSFTVPRCLVDEVRFLNAKGVGVRAAGCLRMGKTGFIKVTGNHVPLMELFGYEGIDPGSFGITDARNAYFISKSEMPRTKEPERWEDWVKRNG